MRCIFDRGACARFQDAVGSMVGMGELWMWIITILRERFVVFFAASAISYSVIVGSGLKFWRPPPCGYARRTV